MISGPWSRQIYKHRQSFEDRGSSKYRYVQPYAFTLFIWKLVFEWCMTRLEVKKWTPKITHVIVVSLLWTSPWWVSTTPWAQGGPRSDTQGLWHHRWESPNDSSVGEGPGRNAYILDSRLTGGLGNVKLCGKHNPRKETIMHVWAGPNINRPLGINTGTRVSDLYSSTLKYMVLNISF
jgi:hypothetical protein